MVSDRKKKIFTVGIEQKRYLTDRPRHVQYSESCPLSKKVGDPCSRIFVAASGSQVNLKKKTKKGHQVENRIKKLFEKMDL